MASAQRLILVDGSSLIYRAFFAIPSNFTTTAGLPTNAIFGFASMFRKILSGKTPEFAAVVFDAPGPSFRAERYPEYKAQRPRMDSRLREQLKHIDAVVDAHDFTRLRMIGYEADDIIGTLTRMAVAAGHEVHIISGDKDFAQLIGPQVRMIDTLRDITFDAELVRKKWGVVPERFVDYLALQGDKADNIPGVAGIGAKGAAKLIEAYPDLDSMIRAAQAEEIKGRAGAALRGHADDARMSHELASLDLQVPLEELLPGGLEDLRVQVPEVERLNAVYREYEFFSLLDASDADEDAEIGADADYDYVADYEELGGFVQELHTHAGPVVVLPFMDHGASAYGPLAGLCMSLRPGHARYVCIDGVDGLGEDALQLLAPWFEDAARPKTCCDAKHLWVHLQRRERAIELRGVAHDVRLESFLVEPTKVIPHELSEIVKLYLHKAISPRKRVTGAGKQARLFSEVEADDAFAWACERADLVGQLAPLLRAELEQIDLVDQLFEMDLPLAWTLGRMEIAGIAVDPENLAAMGEEFRGRLAGYEAKIFELAGREFNIRSTKQLGAVLFDELGLPVIKRTKSGYSTNAEVLERLRPKHEIAGHLLDHRKLTKLINTYTDVLHEAVNPETGRIHCIFQQTVGATGRLISTDPDLQRTPVKTAEGARIREAFVAPAGTQLIAADWSQIELRLLAHFTGDPLLVEAFTNGEDVHRKTAAQLFDCRPQDIEKAQRDVGKLVNFATIYGQGASALGQILGIKRAQAQAYIDGYFHAYAGVRTWLDETIVQAHACGYVTTLAGRRRYIPELSSNAFMERQAGERIAANTPIQGSAADLCKWAMLRIDQALRERKLGARLLLQIHDELVLEVPDAEVDVVSELVRDAMEHAHELRVPLVVDLGVGGNWAAAKG